MMKLITDIGDLNITECGISTFVNISDYDTNTVLSLVILFYSS